MRISKIMGKKICLLYLRCLQLEIRFFPISLCCWFLVLSFFRIVYLLLVFEVFRQQCFFICGMVIYNMMQGKARVRQRQGKAYPCQDVIANNKHLPQRICNNL